MRTKVILAITGLALLALGAACSNGEAATTPETGTEAPAAAPISAPQPLPQEEVGTEGGAVVGAPEPAVEPIAPVREPSAAVAVPALGGSAPYPPSLLQVGSSQSGIWVTGRGSVSLEPDLSVVNIGVEATASTVAEARGLAATAMDAIIQAVKAHGLEDKDVQTLSFNIFPRYEFPEITEGGIRTRKQTLVGYTVNNTASIKIRDLTTVGEIIDDVAEAGGDATRINGISFTVEDTEPFMVGLREKAVQDALAKAQHFAQLTGVSVGALAYIAEIGSGGPVVQQFAAEGAFRVAAAAPVSPISGGELELTLRVQAVFGIQ